MENQEGKKKKIYHYSTDGKRVGKIFYDDIDFVGGMNDIATTCVEFNDAINNYKVRIIIHCFILMDNHLHIVIEGTEEDCDAFMKALVWRIAMRIRSRHGEVRFGSQIIYDKKEIDSSDYYLRCIAYDCRNALDKKVIPLYYKWSTSSLYFNERRNTNCVISRKSLSQRKYRRLCLTHKEIPDDWLISEDGLILPSNYVNYREVEERFGSVSRFMMMLGRKVENDADMDGNDKLYEFKTDRELETAALQIAQMKYNVKGLYQLTTREKVKLATELRRMFGTKADQLSRILGIQADFLK